MIASNFELLSQALKAFSDYEKTFSMEDRDRVVLSIHKVLGRTVRDSNAGQGSNHSLSDVELDRLIESKFGRLLHPNQLVAQREFAREVIAVHNAKI